MVVDLQNRHTDTHTHTHTDTHGKNQNERMPSVSLLHGIKHHIATIAESSVLMAITQFIPKTIGNRKKRLCVRLRLEDKHHLRKSAD